MRYLTAVLVVVLLVVVDVVLIVSVLGLIIAAAMIDNGGSFPTSYRFASSVWSPKRRT